MKIYRMEIVETGRGSLKEKASRFNEIEKEFESIADMRKFLVDNYGKMPGMKNGVYVDTKEGESIKVGFTYSFWNQDISHMSKKWFQTDWITFDACNLERFDLKELRQ